MKEVKTSKKQPTYENGFREQLVKMVESGRSVGGVAKEYGLSPSTLRNWKDAMVKGDDFHANGAQNNAKLLEENVALKKKLREYELSQDILKKAMVIMLKT